MLNRHLSLRLFGPTVLLSLLLVGTCVVVALYLNELHVNVAGDLRENFDSMQAAHNLETTVRELINFLRVEHSRPGVLREQVTTYNHRLHDELAESQRLANRAEEQNLVANITSGVVEYEKVWDKRKPRNPPKGRHE